MGINRVQIHYFCDFNCIVYSLWSAFPTLDKQFNAYLAPGLFRWVVSLPEYLLVPVEDSSVERFNPLRVCDLVCMYYSRHSNFTMDQESLHSRFIKQLLYSINANQLLYFFVARSKTFKNL